MGPTMSCRLSVEYGRESAGNRRHQRDPIDFKFALGQRKREDLGIDKIERLIISGSGVRNPDVLTCIAAQPDSGAENLSGGSVSRR